MWHNFNLIIVDIVIVIRVDMKIIDRCSNCFSSSSSADDKGKNNKNNCKNNSDGEKEVEEAEYAEIDKSKNKRKKKRNLLMPLAILMLNAADKKINDQREFYSKFYTASCIQPHVFSRGKKYVIERKHKIKKRDLRADKLSNNAISEKYIAQLSANVDNEGESEIFYELNKNKFSFYDFDGAVTDDPN